MTTTFLILQVNDSADNRWVVDKDLNLVPRDSIDENDCLQFDTFQAAGDWWRQDPEVLSMLRRFHEANPDVQLMNHWILRVRITPQ